MKKGDFSFKHLYQLQPQRSLSKFRSQNVEQRAESISHDLLGREQSNVAVRPALSVSKDLHCNQELLKRIKQLQAELKRKLTDNMHLAKLFRSKTPSELSHLNVYLEVTRLEDELQVKQISLDETTMRLKETQSAYQQLESRLQEQQLTHLKEIESLSTQVDLIQSQHQLKEAERGGKINSLQNDAARLVRDNEQLTNKLTSANKQIETLKTKENAHKNDQLLLKETKKKYQEITERYKNSEENKNNLAEEAKAMRDQIEKLTLRMRQTQQHLKDEQRKNSQLKEDNSKAKDKIKTIQQNCDALMASEAQKGRQLTQTEERVRLLGQETSVKDNELHELRTHIHKTEASFALCKERICLLQSDYQNIVQISRQSEAHQRQLVQQVTALRHQIQASQKLLSSRSKEATEKVKTNQDQLKKTETQVLRLNSVIRRKQFQNEQLSNGYNKSQQQINILKESLHEAEQKVVNAQLQSAYESPTATTQVYKAIGRLIELSRKIRRGKDSAPNFDTLDAAITALNDQVEELLARMQTADSNRLLLEQRMNLCHQVLKQLGGVQCEELSNLVEQFTEGHSKHEMTVLLSQIKDNCLEMKAVKQYASDRGGDSLSNTLRGLYSGRNGRDSARRDSAKRDSAKREPLLPLPIRMETEPNEPYESKIFKRLTYQSNKENIDLNRMEEEPKRKKLPDNMFYTKEQIQQKYLRK